MTYSSTASLTRRMSIKKNQNVTGFKSSNERLGPVSNTIILIVLACLVGLLYLTQVTKTNSYGYQINELQKRQSGLIDEKADLENTAARLQSIDRVQSSLASKNLVSTIPTTTLQN
jgi:hypothetical protein